MDIANNAVYLENGGNGRKNKNQENQLKVACTRCGRRLRNNRGVINHLRFRNPAPTDHEVGRPPPLAAVKEVGNDYTGTDDAIAEQQFLWGNTPGGLATEELKECYEKIVFCVKICYAT